MVIKKILKEWEGAYTANKGENVTVSYTAMLEDGTVLEKRGIDETQPLKFVTDEEQVITGLDRAVATMKKGEKAIISIHPDYAFGNVECESMRHEIRTSTNAMTSVPKLLKFMRPHYGTLKAYYETMTASLKEPISVALSTVGEDGKPSARVVLLKGLDKDEFVWFTNYGKEGFAASSYASGFGAIYLSVGGMLLYVLSFALGAGPILCLLMSEILPGKIRTEAMTICLVVHWVINFFVGLFFLRLLEQMGAQLLYDIFGAFCLLAVGCKSEICIWSTSYSGNTTSARSGTISYVGSLFRGSGIRYILVDFLRSQNGEHVSDLTWSPDGRYLASASYESSSFIVWYVTQGVGSPIRRGLGGISMLKWSPTGDYFFASKFDRTFYLWKKITWTSEQWSSTSSGFVKCATWDPDGRMVLLAFYNFSVMIVQFKQWDPGVILEP
ncbi:uncharacterized protein LOC131614117 [Vicia villosa]|uniref:uncharacterized protein LOC131614117 n=1 Tax=Vicia villosa TaxID=3911 RepID=UPI00273CD984|nr:uncharacterized protein LOC131614117 [Vicia villosa]